MQKEERKEPMLRKVSLLHCSASICEKTHTHIVLNVDGKQVIGDSEGSTLEESTIGAVNNALGINVPYQFSSSTLTRAGSSAFYNLILILGGKSFAGFADGVLGEVKLYVMAYLELLDSSWQLNDIAKEKEVVKVARSLWADEY